MEAKKERGIKQVEPELDGVQCRSLLFGSPRHLRHAITPGSWAIDIP